jgi:hypothetical protein
MLRTGFAKWVFAACLMLVCILTLKLVHFFVVLECGFPSCALCFLLVLAIQLKDCTDLKSRTVEATCSVVWFMNRRAVRNP